MKARLSKQALDLKVNPLLTTFCLICLFQLLVHCNIFFFCFSITAVLSNKCGFQLQYQMIFCIWLLAFSPQLCEQLRRYNVVPALSDILQESVKEKVTRIILAAFRVSSEFFTLLASLKIFLFHGKQFKAIYFYSPVPMIVFLSCFILYI